MRVLIGGILGAAASAAAWYGLENVLEKEMGYLALAVGLVTGLAVSAAAGKVSGGSYLRGALAALLALGGIVGGQMVKAEIMKAASKEDAKKVAIKAPANDTADDEEDGEAGEAVEAEESAEDLPDRTEFVGGEAGMSKPNIKKSAQSTDMIWICGAALVAYLTGKGGDGPKAATEEEPADAPAQDEDADEA